MSPAPAVARAWQGALAAEHQAVFGYGLLGPQLAGSEQSLAVACSNAHERVRDDVEAAMTAAGLTPVAPQPDYPGLYPVAGAAAARRLAERLEDACAAAYRYLYEQSALPGGTDPARRGEAQTQLTASAVRAARWRLLVDPARATTAFPGI